MSIAEIQGKRTYKFEIQDAASEILGREWGVSNCMRTAVKGAAIQVKHNGERASYHGLFCCQSPWTCPLCAPRILAGRRGEIENVLQKAAVRGLRSLFITVTLSHYVNSRLAELLKALTESWRFVFSGDRTGERAPLSRVKAQIKSVEVRYGRNGWHPHLHVLLLVDESGLSGTEAGIFEDELAECIFSRYARKAEKLGMRAEREGYHARIISIAGAAACYVTKLESALEMTQGQEKESKARSYSAFQLLAAYQRGTRQVFSKAIDDLYREYASATKGKRQVSYSREIKALLGIEEKADEEFTEDEQKEDKVLALIPPQLWRVVCARKLRAALLDIADSGDELRVGAWLDALEVIVLDKLQL